MQETTEFDLGHSKIDATHYAFESLKDYFWPTKYSSKMSDAERIKLHNRQIEYAFQAGRSYQIDRIKKRN